MIDSGIVWAVMGHSTTMNVLRSHDHGPAHWSRVELNGRLLSEKTPGCDLLVVEFFALFHDSMRDDEYDDPEHGLRGFELAVRIEIQDHFSERQWGQFHDACVYHDKGYTSTDPTIGVCWDADRLDLGRVGIHPTAEFFSTEAGLTALAEL